MSNQVKVNYNFLSDLEGRKINNKSLILMAFICPGNF